MPSALTCQTADDESHDAATDDERGEVHDGVGPHGGELVAHGRGVGDVGGRRDGLAAELRHEVAADEAVGTGDEDRPGHWPGG